ncbi:MAG: AAA family ATPase [Spirochaetales bacterium]|jgi:cytidylate kinase|nr:AAA family ATPase [Spirochaetales bacterium]MBR6348439.1 AAA family ATPase [Spirochaetales bacterium]
MRIAVSGKSGCGNTTVSTLLAKRLGYPMINFTFRQMAQERNMDFWDFCALANRDDNIDKELDRRQVEMAMAQENCILGSRLAIWMLKDADFKVYLLASDRERARRIAQREGGTIEERLAQTQDRDGHDTERYGRIYGIDNNDTSQADLVIDTEGKTPEQIVDLILAALPLQKK